MEQNPFYIQHCNKWIGTKKRWALLPEKGERALKVVYVLSFVCPNCNQLLHYTYSLKRTGEYTNRVKIKTEDYINHWMKRIMLHQLDANVKESGPKVSEFTSKISRPPDQNIEYLKQVLNDFRRPRRVPMRCGN